MGALAGEWAVVPYQDIFIPYIVLPPADKVKQIHHRVPDLKLPDRVVDAQRRKKRGAEPLNLKKAEEPDRKPLERTANKTRKVEKFFDAAKDGGALIDDTANSLENL